MKKWKNEKTINEKIKEWKSGRKNEQTKMNE